MSSIQDHPNWVELDDGVSLATLTFYEALQYTQNYESIGGNTVQRLLDGTGVKQTNWSKLRTTISGSGGIPLGFSALNYSGALTLKCGATRAVTSSSNIITITGKRRTDSPYLPSARKRVDGFYIPAQVGLAGNVATVVSDPAAQAYMVLYYPLITVLMNNPSETSNVSQVSTGWSISAEEV